MQRGDASNRNARPIYHLVKITAGAWK